VAEERRRHRPRRQQPRRQQCRAPGRGGGRAGEHRHAGTGQAGARRRAAASERETDGARKLGGEGCGCGILSLPCAAGFALDCTTRLLLDEQSGPAWPAATVRCCCGLRPLGAAALATCLKQTGQTMTPGRITSKRESRPFWPLPGCPPQPPSSLEMAKDIRNPST